MIQLSDGERTALAALPTRMISVSAGQVILRAGVPSSTWLLVLKGIASTSKDLEGGKRQIMAFHLPGDMPVLMSTPDRELDIDLVAVSACSLASMDTVELVEACRSIPRIGELLWECALTMTSIQREWIVNVGHRTAVGRLAHLLCELVTRLEAVGLVQDKACDFPLTQVHLSQATGLTRIHVNRVCQELRKRGLLTLEAGRLILHDWEGLAQLGQFDPTYLHLPATRGTLAWIGDAVA
ncbi:Crp/Fnr family transcriptional regulator [Rubellimicrobium roseum]|uniref:Crp/Fnr family transcriptional regulator n=1 Tax=Rubellimicrobium roseum TaxID=687525 RepID=UPI00159BA7DE|nr:Crp/Fnr family transcriptional regulator [Rubellimicrobium roseum]